MAFSFPGLPPAATMVRPTQPMTARTILYGIAIPLAVALVTVAARAYDVSKLDTTRFVGDSIDTYHQRNELRAVLFRIDSTTKATKQMVEKVCARTVKVCE